MRNKDFLVLIMGFCFFMALSIQWAKEISAATLKIEYEYGAGGVLVGARATLDGDLVGKAYVKDVVKGNYLIRETHYSPRTGDRIYECESKFDSDGMKIEEERISGQKIMEIFRSWP